MLVTVTPPCNQALPPKAVIQLEAHQRCDVSAGGAKFSESRVPFYIWLVRDVGHDIGSTICPAIFVLGGLRYVRTDAYLKAAESEFREIHYELRKYLSSHHGIILIHYGFS